MAIYWTFGNFLKPLATINLPKSLTVLGNFCVGAKIFNFSSEIIFGLFLWTFGDFSLVTLVVSFHLRTPSAAEGTNIVNFFVVNQGSQNARCQTPVTPILCDVNLQL